MAGPGALAARELGPSVPVGRGISAGLLMIPILIGLGVTSTAGDVLYPNATSDHASAVLGSWLVAASFVCFLLYGALRDDPRGVGVGLSGVPLVAALPLLWHDRESGFAMSPVTLFLIPTLLVGLTALTGPGAPITSTRTLERARDGIVFVGMVVGLVACWYWSEAGARGLSVKMWMVLGGVTAAVTVAVAVVLLVWKRGAFVAAALGVAALVGAIFLREYWSAQLLLFSAAALLSLRISALSGRSAEQLATPATTDT